MLYKWLIIKCEKGPLSNYYRLEMYMEILEIAYGQQFQRIVCFYCLFIRMIPYVCRSANENIERKKNDMK